MSEYDDASFDEYVRKQIADRDDEINRLRAENAALRKQIGLPGLGEGLTFKEKTGTHADASGQHFCTKCFLKDDKRVPLKNEPHGWRCLICSKYYEDPDRPEGPLPPIDYGPSSWMA
jgi:hypothetical protein